MSRAYARHRATVSNTVVTFRDIVTDKDEIDAAAKAEIQAVTASLVFSWDSSTTALTTANGHILQAGESRLIEGNKNITNLKFLRLTTTDAAIQITLEQNG